MLKVTSSGIVDGKIERRFGKFSDEQLHGMPIRSLPVSWSDLPAGTKSLTLVMQDYDAVPVGGFSWIHWTVADINPSLGGLPENASRTDKNLIQGKNSLTSRGLGDEVTCFYGGPRPPDKDHEYEVRVFALDAVLGLKKGFYYNELIRAMRGHILDEGVIYGWGLASE